MKALMLAAAMAVTGASSEAASYAVTFESEVASVDMVFYLKKTDEFLWGFGAGPTFPLERFKQVSDATITFEDGKSKHAYDGSDPVGISFYIYTLRHSFQIDLVKFWFDSEDVSAYFDTTSVTWTGGDGETHTSNGVWTVSPISQIPVPASASLLAAALGLLALRRRTRQP